MPNLDIIYDVTIVIRWDEIKPINRWFINLLEIFQWHITSTPYANESQLVTIVEKIHKICKWSFRRTGKLFVFFVC